MSLKISIFSILLMNNFYTRNKISKHSVRNSYLRKTSSMQRRPERQTRIKKVIKNSNRSNNKKKEDIQLMVA